MLARSERVSFLAALVPTPPTGTTLTGRLQFPDRLRLRFSRWRNLQRSVRAHVHDRSLSVALPSPLPAAGLARRGGLFHRTGQRLLGALALLNVQR